jgi:class 3 adenylate cyclase
VVTLLFSDVEGSTGLVQRLGEVSYAASLAEHRELLRAAIEGHAGREVDCRADEYFAVFTDAAAALVAALAVQQAVAAHVWPEEGAFRVRIGVHTGDPLVAGEGYVGVDVNRAARLCSAGHGGQVLVSQRVLDAAGAGFDAIDLGEYHIAGIPEPERIFQIVVPGGRSRFPSLRDSAAKRSTDRRRDARPEVALVPGAEVAWRAREVLPRVSSELRTPVAELAASLFTLSRSVERAQVFLDRLDRPRLDSLLEAQREMLVFSRHAEREAAAIEAQVNAVHDVERLIQALREAASRTSDIVRDPDDIDAAAVISSRDRIAAGAAKLDDAVTHAVAAVGPLAFKRRRTRCRGVFRSGGRFVVPYIDAIGADRMRDFETLGQARDFRDAIRLSQKSPYTGPHLGTKDVSSGGGG